MSFQIKIKAAKLSPQHQKIKEQITIVITSPTRRLFYPFVNASANPVWTDILVASDTERDIDFMLVRSKEPRKMVKKLSSIAINLSKYLFQSMLQTDEILLESTSGKVSDRFTIEVGYFQSRHFVGPIQLFAKDGQNLELDDIVDMQVENDNASLPFWKMFFTCGNNQENDRETEVLLSKEQKNNVQYYKGPQKRSFFSFCDQVYDDQKFTAAQNYYENK